MIVQLPAHGWKPRPLQMAVWNYLESGGRHAEMVWHRRFGKDDVGLHWTARSAFTRIGTYWYMLPMQTQARRAIWKAINPHTGRRRIDEAFPPDLRKATNDQEMFIEFRNGSTWQVLGSDNYNALVGSPPVGCVFSEWALADPAAAAYLQPIFNENKGWQIYNTTPRGKNHAYRSLQVARENPRRFASVLTLDDTKAFTPDEIVEIRADYIARFGEELGEAIFQQEYYCSFDIPVVGAVYGREIRAAQKEGRICRVPYDPSKLVHTFWDLGRADKTTIWFAQHSPFEVRVIDYVEGFGKHIGEYIAELQRKPYKFGTMWLPHDANNELLVSKRTVAQQMRDANFNVRVVPKTSIATRIEATRLLFPLMYFDDKATSTGRDAISNYRYDVKGVPIFTSADGGEIQTFSADPIHDWASHASDALGYMAVALKEDREKREAPAQPPRRVIGNVNDFGGGWMNG